MPVYDYKFLLDTDVDECAAASTYSGGEINFGITNPDVGQSNMYGVHIVITTTYTNLESGVQVWYCHGAATTPTTKLAARLLPVADMVAGAHFFFPLPPKCLQYSRLKFVPVSETSSNGALTAWLGPKEGGEI